jgi:hypothetical protein
MAVLVLLPQQVLPGARNRAGEFGVSRSERLFAFRASQCNYVS